MSAGQDPARAAELERRYRRLLRCYPPSHRAAHREEMLGVLLAAARPGQRRPGAAQTLNLAACGLAIRARRALDAEPWQDALAVVSLWELALTPGLGGPAAVMTGWLAVVLLALAGRRRAAAALACIPLTLDLAVVLNLVTQQTGAWSGGLPMFLWTAGGARPSWPA